MRIYQRADRIEYHPETQADADALALVYGRCAYVSVARPALLEKKSRVINDVSREAGALLRFGPYEAA